MRDIRSGIVPPIIDLDSMSIERSRNIQSYRLNVIQIPSLRLIGYCLLIICILFHNLFLLDRFSLSDFFEISSIILLYASSSWIVLFLSFGKIDNFDIGFVFLVLDVFIWTLVIYYSGGEKSLLFWLMVMRVADQVNT